MARVKRGVHAAKKRRTTLERTAGYRGQRINAGSRAHGLTYNRFIQGLKAAGIEVDRRVLSELATNDPAAFAALVEIARQHVINA